MLPPRRRGLKRFSRGRKGPPAGPSPPNALVSYEMACICGQLLMVRDAADHKRCGCPTCGRKFLATFSTDPATKLKTLVPLYLDDIRRQGDTYVAERKEASPPPEVGADSKEALRGDTVLMPSPSQSPQGKGALDEAIFPEPPPAMYFICPCGSKLLARKEMYDRRVRCPDCDVRMIISLVYDAGAKMFDLKPVRVSDPPSGDTRALYRA